MLEKKQHVTIKGTKDGLTIVINDSCSLNEVIDELKRIIPKRSPQQKDPHVSVIVQLGNRYVTEEEKKQLIEIIQEDDQFRVQSFESHVISKEEALRWKEKSEVKVFNKIVRSGQVLEVTGDLLLIGDVNPGGTVQATGNIYILGSLYGIAHAGIEGDRHAVIVASYMKPSQLRIADCISRAPDYESVGVYMECGMIDEKENKIVIDRLQVLNQSSKYLSSFERRMKNG